MKDLEKVLYNQINNDNKEGYMNYISSFYTLSYSSHHLNERKSALLGFISFVKVIKKINDEKSEHNNEQQNSNQNKIFHIDIINKLTEKLYQILKERNDEIVYFAALCLYNIMVSFNSYVLNNLKFFLDSLLIIVTKTGQKILSISNDLENALKSIIINHSFKKFEVINAHEFFKLLFDSLSLKSCAIRRLVTSIIYCFNKIPDFHLINILHLFLKDLFDMLKDSEDNSLELKNTAKKCLDAFYNDISLSFNEIPINVRKNILNSVVSQVNEIIKKAENIKDLTDNTFTPLIWIFLFIKQIKPSKNDMKKEEFERIHNFFDILPTILKIIFDILKNKNEDSEKEFEKKDDKNGMTYEKYIKDLDLEIKALVNKYYFAIINNKFQIAMDYNKKKEFENIILEYLTTENENLLPTTFEWLKTFFDIFGEEAFSDCQNFIGIASYIFTSKNKSIFEKGIDVLNKIFDNNYKRKEEKLKEFLVNFLNNLENKDIEFVENRIIEFIKLLNEKIEIQKVYSAFAKVLEELNNSEFAIKIINIINKHLLKSNNSEIIKYKKNEPTANEYFKTLFTTWSKNSFSCLILCLIAEDYELSYNLLKCFGTLNLTQDEINEFSNILNIFESKEFTSK